MGLGIGLGIGLGLGTGLGLGSGLGLGVRGRGRGRVKLRGKLAHPAGLTEAGVERQLGKQLAERGEGFVLGQSAQPLQRLDRREHLVRIR